MGRAGLRLDLDTVTKKMFMLLLEIEDMLSGLLTVSSTGNDSFVCADG
jgi:hypothetical protein